MITTVESHVESLPFQRIWDKRADSYIGKTHYYFSWRCCFRASLQPFLTRSSLPSLIVNEFFKCKPGIAHTFRGICHIPRCKSKVNPQIRFQLAGCSDIVRTRKRASSFSVRCLPCKPGLRQDLPNDFEGVLLNHLPGSSKACQTCIASLHLERLMRTTLKTWLALNY